MNYKILLIFLLCTLIIGSGQNLKELNKSGLFKSVDISFDNNFFYINVVEYPTINKVFYQNNKRIKDEQIDQLISDLEIFTL